ncbi:putative gustatory receptor 28a isoform X1 [Cotesia glomerata]|uniref:putative gustatory receptor 28a isoform X1 n=2 Tax=Cotesia glomerata TaxID=32391 RepID=UPI001D0093FA|nr:putative gustatory receptor 28a isoform X1 [Cotesia glomerata]
MYYNAYRKYNQNLMISKFYFFKILGLSPWSLNLSAVLPKNRHFKITLCKFSYVGSLYNISLAILVTISGFYAFHRRSVIQGENDALLTVSTVRLMEYLAILKSSVLFLIYTLRQKKMISVINGINNVNYRLEKYGWNISRDYLIINMVFIINVFLSVVLVTLELCVLSFSEALMRCFPSILFCWFLVQYTIVLDVINKRFKYINLSITKLGSLKENSELPQRLFITKLSFLHESVICDVINLKHAYNNLCEICRVVADFYGLIILGVILHNGAVIILILYFTLLRFFSTEEIVFLKIISQGVCVLWMMFQIVVFTTYVDKTIDQSKKTASIINALIRQNRMDDKVEKELLKFLRDLSFRKIKFTAYEIISLDRSILANLAGTVATYLIILIQFRVSAPPESSTSTQYNPTTLASTHTKAYTEENMEYTHKI